MSLDPTTAMTDEHVSGLSRFSKPGEAKGATNGRTAPALAQNRTAGAERAGPANIIEAPDWMVIDAVRYAIGRRSYQVGITCGWLRGAWPKLTLHVRQVVQHDVEEAFLDDDRDRAAGREHKALGWDCDRRDWESVRALWRQG